MGHETGEHGARKQSSQLADTVVSDSGTRRPATAADAGTSTVIPGPAAVAHAAQRRRSTSARQRADTQLTMPGQFTSLTKAGAVNPDGLMAALEPGTCLGDFEVGALLGQGRHGGGVCWASNQHAAQGGVKGFSPASLGK